MPSQKGGALFGSDPYANYMTEGGVNSGVVQYVYYFIGITLIVLLLLVLVNYTITPIFRTRPGGKGVIPLPGTDDSSLFWKNTNNISVIADQNTPINSKSQLYSFLLDIQVDDPTAATSMPRVLFSRGGIVTAPEQPYSSTDTILVLNPSFNSIVYLDHLTNDLHVAVQTLESNGTRSQVLVESIIIPNIPVRKAVRLGVMVGDRVLEVYINGYLVRSKTFTKPVRDITGDIQPPADNILSRVARIANLRIWNRPLSPSEFRAYGSATDFDMMPVADSCGA
jgi:hypothetical protein